MSNDEGRTALRRKNDPEQKQTNKRTSERKNARTRTKKTEIQFEGKIDDNFRWISLENFGRCFNRLFVNVNVNVERWVSWAMPPDNTSKWGRIAQLEGIQPLKRPDSSIDRQILLKIFLPFLPGENQFVSMIFLRLFNFGTNHFVFSFSDTIGQSLLSLVTPRTNHMPSLTSMSHRWCGARKK